YSFEVFRNNLGDSTSIGGNAISSICEDRNHNLWFGTEDGGLSVYDRYTNTFKNYKPGPEPHTISYNVVSFIHEDQHGKLWIATSGNGVDRYNPETKQFKHFGHDYRDTTRLMSQYIKQIMSDRAGNVWIANDAGLTKVIEIDEDSVVFKTYRPDPNNPDAIANNYAKACVEDNNGILWVATDAGLSRFDPKTEKFKNYFHDPNDPHSVPSTYVKALGLDTKGRLWVGSDGGASIFDEETETFQNFKPNTENPKSLSNTYVKTIFVDPSGTVWIGTDDGVNVYDPNKEQFELYQFPIGDGMYEVVSNNTFCIFEDKKGNIWTGTDNGINFYNPNTKRIAHYQHDPTNPKTISNNIVKSIHQDDDGVLWVGTDNGLNKVLLDQNYRIVKVETFHYEDGKASLSNNSVVQVFEDHTGMLWIATWGGGINTFDKTTNTFKAYKANDNVGVSSDQIHAFYEDVNRNIWIGTRAGLNVYDRANDRFMLYHNDPNNPESLGNDWVLSLGGDKDGKIWIGTNGGGLNLFDPKTKKFKRFNKDDGLTHDVIQSILVDEGSNVWMSSSVGLIRFDVKAQKFFSYDINDGLQGFSFYLGCAHQNPEGYMYFGGAKGFNRFKPNGIIPNTYVPPVYVNKLKIFDEEITPNNRPDILSRVISETAEITLSHKDAFLQFEFVALNFRNSIKNQYEYKLEPLQKDWIQTTATRRDATYTSLDPGVYSFRVRASNNDGTWNEEGRTLKITITPPWYQTPLAIASFVLLALGSTYLFYRVRTANLRKKKEQLQRLVNERTGELQAANKSLHQQKEEIVVQNEELQQQAEEIASQRDKIEAQHHALEEAYNDISVISEVGKDITGSLSLDNIFVEVYKDVNILLQAPTFAIGVYQEEEDVLEFIEIDGQGSEISRSKDDLNNQELLSVRCFRNKETILINNFSEQYPESTPASGQATESIIYLPLISKEKKIGVITAQSPEKNRYGERHVTLLESLASYAATALDNSMAYDIINTKNKLITDSIRYAQTIQEAILPQQSRLRSAFSDHFVLFKPKDIVSGDFYWYMSVPDLTTGKEIHYLAVVDCTGHGVPGAFMSMIGARILNEVLIEKGKRVPSEILELVNLSIVTALKQDTGDKQANNDGMDLAICCIEHFNNASSKVIFAGAKSSIYHYKTGSQELVRLRGDNRSIGGIQRHKEPFTDQELILAKGDRLYLATDGFADQNSASNRKIGSIRFAELLHESATLDMSAQKDFLLNTLLTHQQGAEQRDDITVIGVQV
ncbi:MAG: two-component regulator propeller domain-containing protein, partial [Flammeovirgaceae bacterium]